MFSASVSEIAPSIHSLESMFALKLLHSYTVEFASTPERPISTYKDFRVALSTAKITKIR